MSAPAKLIKAIAARLASPGRWICPPPCGAINPDITSTCIRCGK